MKLLMTTQALDLDDPVLSAYHGWVKELASRVEKLEVIVLKEDQPGECRVALTPRASADLAASGMRDGEQET